MVSSQGRDNNSVKVELAWALAVRWLDLMNRLEKKASFPAILSSFNPSMAYLAYSLLECSSRWAISHQVRSLAFTILWNNPAPINTGTIPIPAVNGSIRKRIANTPSRNIRSPTIKIEIPKHRVTILTSPVKWFAILIGLRDRWNSWLAWMYNVIRSLQIRSRIPHT